MLPSPNLNANVLPAIHPAVIKDDAAYTAQVIDLTDPAVRGAQFLTFVAHVGSIDADLAVLRVQESDTKSSATALGGSPATVVDALASVVPGTDDDGKIYLITVDLRAEREQFLQLQATAGDGAAGTYLSAICLAVVPGAIATNNNAAAVIAG